MGQLSRSNVTNSPAVINPEDAGYGDRVAAELQHFHEKTVVLDLPPIYHYWSNKWILPKLHAFGLFGVTEMFEKYLVQHCQAAGTRECRFLSIGSGNCETELDLARRLRAKGLHNFVIECLELNPAMLARAQADAERDGVAAHLLFVQADLNSWRAVRTYDVVLAAQILHHVIHLEGLFAQVRQALAPTGHFVVADMIGRNGHLRWPEALDIVQEYWQELPSSYRYNRQLGRQEDQFVNWDCSNEGFEGIRAQDILPLLLQSFHFEIFVAFGNAVLPFVDRAFGPNFNAGEAWDQDFVDRVHLRDHQEMLAGRIKPTIMCAVMGRDTSVPTQYLAPFSPEFCVRGGVPSANVLQEQLDLARRQIDQAAQSKWLRLGRSLGFGPNLR